MSAMAEALAPPITRSGALRVSENLILAASLAGMILLPLAEALLRRLANTGIEGNAVFVQHLTLVVCMLGAALAARDGKLLKLFEFASLGRPRVRALGRWIAHVGAAAASLALGLAGLRLAASERAAGTVIAYGVPVWTIQLLLPLGFALIALRLLRGAAEGRAGRLAAAALLALLAAAAPLWAQHAELGFAPAVVMLALCALAGAPIFAVLGGLALLLFWREQAPLAAVALDQYTMVVNPSLPTIPLFTLAGFVLAAGRAPQRLTELFQALFGHFSGGIGIAAVVVGAFFTAFTGGSGVTILALGGVLLPLMVAARYRERDAIGLVTVAGSLGTLLAPCLPLVLYAIVAKIGIERMFVGALLPALLLIAMVAVWSARRAPRDLERTRAFDPRRAWRAIVAAKWELALPGVVFASLFGGFATPVEAAALTALYVFAVELLVHRDLRDARRLLESMAECGALVGGVLLILGVALGLTNYLVDIQWPDHAVAWATRFIHSRWLFLLALNGLLLGVGSVMEVWSAIVVLPPLLVPVGRAFGVDPVHLGVIFLANLELGYLTPLVGINLFYASSRFDRPILEVCRAVLPLIPVIGLGVLIITYVPWLSTVLPGLIR
jgi:C4-dicarboxylate transporter DctM subunit